MVVRIGNWGGVSSQPSTCVNQVTFI